MQGVWTSFYGISNSPIKIIMDAISVAQVCRVSELASIWISWERIGLSQTTKGDRCTEESKIYIMVHNISSLRRGCRGGEHPARDCWTPQVWTIAIHQQASTWNEIFWVVKPEPRTLSEAEVSLLERGLIHYELCQHPSYQGYCQVSVRSQNTWLQNRLTLSGELLTPSFRRLSHQGLTSLRNNSAPLRVWNWASLSWFSWQTRALPA